MPSGTYTLMDTIHMGSEPKSHGALIGSVIIVAILIIGGVYYYKSAKMQVAQDQMQAEQIALDANAQAEALKIQSESDVVADIEADLSVTDVNMLGTE